MSNCWKVYMHTSPNGKRYIGITSKPVLKRWGYKGEGYKSNKYFWRAIQKYGWDNFQHDIISINLSEDLAKEIEILLIDKYKTTDTRFGYNLTLGGDGILGYHHSEETKQKIKNSNVGKHSHKMSEESKTKISIALKGRPKPPRTEEHIKKLGDAIRGRKFGPRPDYVKKAIGDANRGRVMSDEQKIKLSNAHKGKKVSDETRQKMREAQKLRRERERLSNSLTEVF